MERFATDPDMQREAAGPAAWQHPTGAGTSPVALSIHGGAHHPSGSSARLVEEAGGVAGLRRFTTAFYKKAFGDPHIDRFIRSHDDPHGERFANWISESTPPATRNPGPRAWPRRG